MLEKFALLKIALATPALQQRCLRFTSMLTTELSNTAGAESIFSDDDPWRSRSLPALLIERELRTGRVTGV